MGTNYMTQDKPPTPDASEVKVKTCGCSIDHEFEVKELINAVLILDYGHLTHGFLGELQGMARRAAGIIKDGSE